MDGHRLSIDGLRLRLDLRIVPGSLGADGSGAAVLRVENANVTTLPLFGVHIPAVYRRAAVLSSLVVLGLALVVWFSSTPVEHGSSFEPAAPQAAPARSAPAVSARAIERAVAPPAAVPPAAVPPAAVPPPPAAGPAAPAVRVEPGLAGVSVGNTSRQAEAAPAAEAPTPAQVSQRLVGSRQGERATAAAPPTPAQPIAADRQRGPSASASSIRSPSIDGASNARRDLLELFADTK
jgi:hypothetical protein